MLRYLILLTFLFSSLCLWSQDHLLAQNYIDQGNYEKAILLYKELIKESPENLDYIISLVNAYQQTEAYKKADSLILTAIDSPYKAILEVELGYNQQLQGEDQQARELYDKAINQASTDAGLASRIARSFQKYNLLEEAIKTYSKAQELNPNYNFDPYLAPLYGELGDFNNMFETYIKLMERDERFESYAQRSISRFISESTANQANQILRKILLTRLQENPNLLYNRMLSWLFVQQKDFRKAYIQEKAIAKRSGDLSSLFTFAQVAEQNQEDVLALEVLNYLIEESPSSLERLYARQNYLRLKLKTANPEEFSDLNAQFEAVLKDYGTSSETLPLQLLYGHFLAFKHQQKEKATTLLNQALELPLQPFDEARVKMLLADILVLEERFNAALIYYSQIQKKLKNTPLAQEARFKVAKTSYYKGDFEWAKTQLKVLKSSAEQLIANDAQDLYLLITDNALNDSTQTALKTYALADLRRYQNQDEEAIQIYDKLLKEYPDEPIQDEALMAQALVYEEQKEFEQAAANYVKIIETHGTDILADDAHYRLGNLYADRLNQPEKAKAQFEQIIFNFADSIFYVDAQQKYRKLRGDMIN